MGFHLIDQTACFAVGQPTVRVCTVPNGRSTQGVNSGRGLACVATAATCFFGWLAWLTSHQRQINGLQRCNSLLCCRAQSYLGSLAISMALQWLRQLSACMCSAMGSGDWLPVVGTWDCTAACAWEVVAMTASGSVVC